MWCGHCHIAFPNDGKCLKCHQNGLREAICEPINTHNAQIIKIHSADVINSMRAGNLWFQSPRYFQEYSGDGQIARADIHDAKYSYIDENGGVDDRNADTYRILSFYSLDVDDQGNILKKPDIRLQEFGSSYSIIDVTTLITEIKNYTISLNKRISFVANWAYYLLENYTGAYSPFCKFQEYAYQNEFRIVLLSNTFLSLQQKEPYITNPPIAKLDKIILPPQPIEKLLNANNINQIE
jgi:hypothetical protein